MSKPRIVAVAVVLVAVAGAFVARLATLQLAPDPRLEAIGTPLAQDPIAAPRGEIVDRFGRALALSLPTPTVIADPRLFHPAEVDAVVDRLTPLLSTSREVLVSRLSTDRAFAYLERQVDPEIGEAVASLEIPGIWLVDEPRRQNPNGACSAIGVIGRVDTDHIGISGLEKLRDEELQGRPGELVYEASADGSLTIPGGREVVTPAAPGTNVALSLDRNVQYRAEELAAAYVERAQGSQASVIIGMPATGEIIAMANVARDAETGVVDCTTTNHAVTWTFEPGSIMKPLTVAGVLRSGLHGAQQLIEVPALIERDDGEDGKEYVDHWLHPDEWMTPTRIIADSSNVGTILLAEKLGADPLRATFADFGLGTPTSLDLPGEASGILGDLGANNLALPSAAIGQGVATTPIQMHQAFSTLANGGVRVAPTVLADATGEIAAEPGERVIDAAVADAVMAMMEQVVVDGTGTGASVPGYRVSGKTGTAWQVCPETGTYWCDDGHRHYTASFVGTVANDSGSVLSITVVIDDAKGTYYAGGTAAAPLFAELASYTVRQLRIPPLSAGAAPSERVRAAAAEAPPVAPDADHIEVADGAEEDS